MQMRKTGAAGVLCVAALPGLFALLGCHARPVDRPPVKKIPEELSEFIFTEAPFAHCHASTIVELADGELLAAWYGGTREGSQDVAIWGARRSGDSWSAPFLLASQPDAASWNPVLFRSADGTVWLFFKTGRNSQKWNGVYRTSPDGKIWSEVRELPEGILGPTRNKPVTLSNGDVLAGSSMEGRISWTVWVDISRDQGRTWRKAGPVKAPGWNRGIIQPTLWEAHPGEVKMLTRASGELGAIYEATSHDNGQTWSTAKKTSLPNPDSGIDAVKMSDGRVALVYNHSTTARTPLNITFSRDDGATWEAPLTLEDAPGEYSYPAIIQTRDGKLHITYTWRRERIKHVVIDPKAIGRE
jgi:predicted neuraminidase